MKHVILGGTGTLGKALTWKLLEIPENQVICVSRCELKQKQMQAEFNHPNLSFRLGDIRDRNFLDSVFVGANTVFHVAALKHIDSLEENPEESVKTNVLGTMNVADAAIHAYVPHVVFSSTDKAVDPINVYGMCKGISEKMLLRRNELQAHTRFSIYRWGNVVGSRGSVIKSFVDTLRTQQKVFVTDQEMTRFWVTLDDAVNFIMNTYPSDRGKEVLIPPMKAAQVLGVVEVLGKMLDIDDYKVVITGIRKGEKIHETIKPGLNSQNGPYYSGAELESILRYPVEQILGAG